MSRAEVERTWPPRTCPLQDANIPTACAVTVAPRLCRFGGGLGHALTQTTQLPLLVNSDHCQGVTAGLCAPLFISRCALVLPWRSWLTLCGHFCRYTCRCPYSHSPGLKCQTYSQTKLLVSAWEHAYPTPYFVICMIATECVHRQKTTWVEFFWQCSTMDGPARTNGLFHDTMRRKKCSLKETVHILNMWFFLR